MPELPEVETVARGLRTFLPGRRILGVRLGKSDFIDDPAALERDLPGRRIAGVERRAKFIAIRLEKDGAAQAPVAVVVHLGMTGQLTAHRPEQPAEKHTHVFFTLDDGRELRYTDPRRFGRMLVADERQLEAVLGRLGADPLEISLREFRRLAGRRMMVKALLLDQSALGGVGNIYADESLWRARVHPRRRASALKEAEVRRLYRGLRRVLTAAIRLGGSTISNYRDAEGRPGEFQLRHRVYDREGEHCFRCGARIRRCVVAGRSSFFCPRCQKK